MLSCMATTHLFHLNNILADTQYVDNPLNQTLLSQPLHIYLGVFTLNNHLLANGLL